jgi:DNA-binding NtrC family response regulator
MAVPLRHKTTVTMDVRAQDSPGQPFIFQLFPLACGREPRALRLGSRTLLGRSADAGCQVVLDDPTASRIHAAFDIRDGCLCIVSDQDSKNGVFVNGSRIETRELCDGDIVRVGSHIYSYREIGLDLPSPHGPELGFIAFSPGFRKSVEECRQAAPTDVPVLLCGETGTGKELLARHVHERSGRTGAFVPVNCAAIAPGLFESALFGHRKGAFTGAAADFGGHVGAAKGGTLFLDEIGELPLEIQAKLLRFLESGEVATVGDTIPRRADARILAATNQDLSEAVRRGGFRSDLFARLGRWVVNSPPLRDRPEDTSLLLAAYLECSPATLSADAAEALLLHKWPYNIRELRNVVEALLRGNNRDIPIPVAALPDAVRSRWLSARGEAQQRTTGRGPSAGELAELIAECDGNVSEIARRLGRDRRQVYRWMDRHGLRDPERTCEG